MAVRPDSLEELVVFLGIPVPLGLIQPTGRITADGSGHGTKPAGEVAEKEDEPAALFPVLEYRFPVHG
jgi:hypothetical protein